MSKIRLLKGGSIQPAFDKNGLSHQPMMENANAEAKLYECVLKAGCTWQPELFPFRKKSRCSFSQTRLGIFNRRRRFGRLNRQFLSPIMIGRPLRSTRGRKILHFLHIVGDLNDYDRATMERWCIKLPRYRNFHQCVQYTEGFTGDAGSNVTSRLLVEGRGCGRWSMGWNNGEGPTFIGEHIHKHLVQWYYVLPDGFFTYIAGGTREDMGPGSLSYTEANTPHGSETPAGKKINYIWLELATNGYPEGPDGFPGL